MVASNNYPARLLEVEEILHGGKAVKVVHNGKAAYVLRVTAEGSLVMNSPGRQKPGSPAVKAFAAAPRVRSEDLLQGQTMVAILHAGRIHILKLTIHGHLILGK